jgi:hypothetical protein
MERTLYLLNAHGSTVTKDEACCFVRQLIQDLKREQPKIKWQREKDTPWGTFFTRGLSGVSFIQLRSYRIQKQPVVFMNYEKDGKFVYNIHEFNGDPANPNHFAHLYKRVAATMAHQEVFGDNSDRCLATKLSVEEMDDRCLKVVDVFRAVTSQEVLDRLMKQPSMANINLSQGSPEWCRRSKQVCNIVRLIQCVRIRESSLILDGFALKKADGTLCGHISTDPIAKWANAYVIIRKDKYPGLAFDEIRVKVASDIIANLLMIL